MRNIMHRKRKSLHWQADGRSYDCDKHGRRGTDIKLGEGVAELGGLKIIGTERHESRRIDNQLRGRAGRQGDPGESRFYISLEDDLMRLFGSEKTMKVVDAMGMTEDEPIEAGMLSKAIENAQKRWRATTLPFVNTFWNMIRS